MSFFKLCSENNSVRKYLYHEIPEQFVWSKKHMECSHEKHKVMWRDVHCQNSLHRKILLQITTSAHQEPQSFDDLRTGNGVLRNPNRVNAEKFHLFINDAECEENLHEAETHEITMLLSWRFATVCIFCSPASTHQMWPTFQAALSEDFQKQHRNLKPTNSHCKY